MLRQVLGLDHHLDPLQMGRQGFAGPGWPLLIRDPALSDLCLQSCDAGLDFFEDKGLLRVLVHGLPIGVKLFRSAAKPGTIIGLQYLHQPLDPLVGIRAARLQGRVLVLQNSRLLRHRADHGLQQVQVIRKGVILSNHGIKDSISRSAMPQAICAPSAGDSLCRGYFIQQIQEL